MGEDGLVGRHRPVTRFGPPYLASSTGRTFTALAEWLIGQPGFARTHGVQEPFSIIIPTWATVSRS